MLKEKLKNYNIILASKSPRRQQFFKDLDLDFNNLKSKAFNNLSEKDLLITSDTIVWLENKALAEKDLLITSDTIVWLENKALGKPKNETDAFKMLQSLSGKKHQVITSISIKGKNFQKIINDVTFVYFKKLSDEEINFYIKNYQPFDKAGGYGIQEWIGFIGIDKIEGNYFNVVGLPVHKLYKELMKL
ncbi:UNVERIFIED_CONTAM: hypothetical protein GTU68_048581 [Idotea baltica]|nr:hypothetical protein [Idotea baltica]